MILKNLAIFLILLSLSVHAQREFPKADSILISRFGKSFCEKYVKIDCDRCHCYTKKVNVFISNCNKFDSSCTRYGLVYSVTIPKKEIQFEIQLTILKSGDFEEYSVCPSSVPDTSWNSTNLPPVLFSHEQLNFLSKKEIEKNAMARNFPKGMKEWTFSTYYWHEPPHSWYMHAREKIKGWGNGRFVSSLDSKISDTRDRSISFDAVTGEYLDEVIGVGIP